MIPTTESRSRPGVGRARTGAPSPFPIARSGGVVTTEQSRAAAAAGSIQARPAGGPRGRPAGRGQEVRRGQGWAGDRLRRVTILWASSDAGSGSRSGPRPTARPANLGYGWGHARFLPGRPCPQTGHTQFVTGSSAGASMSSKYTRWRPRPDTGRTCPR